MAASVTHFEASRCLSASWQMRKRARACKMDSRQLSAVKGASPKRAVGAFTVRRYFWGGPAKRAVDLPLRLCKLFPRREAFRRTTISSVNGATRKILVRGGYSPLLEPAKQGSCFHAVHERQGSMLEVAGTEHTCFGGSSLPFQIAPPDWSHPANRPIATEQEVLMGSKQSFGETHASKGTFRTQLQGVTRFLGALFLANALALFSPPPALAPSVADATDRAGLDAFQKAQGTLLRIAKVVSASLLAAALALCTLRTVLAAQQRKVPASRSASTASRRGDRHAGRDQSTSGGVPVQAVGEEKFATDGGVAVEAAVEEASATDQGGAGAVALEKRAFTSSAAVPVKTVVDERYSVTREGNPSNASGLGGAVLGAGGETAPATRVTNGVQRGGLAGGLGIRLKNAVDAFCKEPQKIIGGAEVAEHEIG